MFDSSIDRRGTSCLKWDGPWSVRKREDMLPFWIADMDFEAPPPVLAALRSRVAHGIFGYTGCPESLIDALLGWLIRRHRWSVAQADVLEVPGIVSFIYIFVQFFTKIGDAVVIQEPVYSPFRQAAERNMRRIVGNPLVKGKNGRWGMDLHGLERILDESGAKTLIFCSPHNPVGRVWTWEELLALADLCREKGVTVLSDEIHADLIQPGFIHHPWLTLPKTRLPRSLSLISPSKTFNIPGLNNSWAVIPHEGFRTEIKSVIEKLGLEAGAANPLVYAAAEAAWREGDSWLDSLIGYIGKNYRRLHEFMSEKQTAVGIAPLEATFLAWLDMSFLSIDEKSLWKGLLSQGVLLSRGSQFGKCGQGYMRMNIACPRKTLEEGLTRMGRVF